MVGGAVICGTGRFKGMDCSVGGLPQRADSKLGPPCGRLR